ncbi:MAG: aminotransferase class IV [Myxococcota bacterium]
MGLSTRDSERVGSYTTARVTGGRVERVERHANRLRRDAGRLGLPLPARGEIESLLVREAHAAFGDGDGIVRVEWAALPGEPPQLIAATRELGPEPPTWRARVATTTHPGAEERNNTKFVRIGAIEEARDELRQHAVEEVLLFDAEGRLVEGSHSNCLLVDDQGGLVTPANRLGCVEGLGLTIVRESHPEIVEADLRLEDVKAARELLAVNCVRGVVPIETLDGRVVYEGDAGDWARRLRRLFFRD